MTSEPNSKKMKTEYPTKPMEGERIPSVVFKARRDGQWFDIKTDEFFKGKNVVVFALPGAFTPTCSSTHLPRYEQLYDCFKKLGIDEVCCVSVNDGFVMDAWMKDQKIKHVILLPDGNHEFTEKMGMLCDKSAIGFGKRSWRYSMLVRDCKIEKIFAEPVKEGDPFEVSDADTMLRYLDPNFKIPPATLMFTKEGCSYCAKARKLLEAKSITYEEVEVGLGGTVSFSALRAVSGRSTTPQVFMEGKHIGGADDLEKYLAENF